jgi:dTDP-4-amino-4,6-dideoxygalactose transaminase
MVISQDESLAERIRKMRDHGASKTDLERHLKEGGSLLPEFNMLGFNYRMTDIQGALGTAQMESADAVINERRRVAKDYHKMLKGRTELVVPLTPEGYAHAYQSYVCIYKGRKAGLRDLKRMDWALVNQLNRERNMLMAGMERRGVSVRQGTHAVHTLGYYREKYGLHIHDCPMSFIADRLTVALPLYCGMTRGEQVRVVNALKEVIEEIR